MHISLRDQNRMIEYISNLLISFRRHTERLKFAEKHTFELKSLDALSRTTGYAAMPQALDQFAQHYYPSLIRQLKPGQEIDSSSIGSLLSQYTSAFSHLKGEAESLKKMLASEWDLIKRVEGTMKEKLEFYNRNIKQSLEKLNESFEALEEVKDSLVKGVVADRLENFMNRYTLYTLDNLIREQQLNFIVELQSLYHDEEKEWGRLQDPLEPPEVPYVPRRF